MKSVLVHINRDEGQEARFQAALDIARAYEGHLTCLQVAPLETFAAVDPYGVGYLLTQTIDQIRELESEEKSKMEADLSNEGVPWDWHSHTGDAGRLLSEHSWLADLVIVSSPGKEWKPRLEAPPTAADVVMNSRAPVLVVPDAARGFDCDAPVAIAWDGSPEACAAIRTALPLLKRASAVHLLYVDGDEEFDLPSTIASEYLSRHGVSSELSELKPEGGPVTDALIQAAETRKVSCVVMGAYGHSRLRESILGGVTRGMLQKAPMPLLLAH